MNAYKIAFLLLFGVSVVYGDLSSPQNLTLQTLNTNYILHWDWGQETTVNGTVTFTAEYIAQYKARKSVHKQTRKSSQKQDWRTLCVDVVERQCDFSNAGLFYFGMFLLRVRAQTAQEFSQWEEIEFCPDKHANLGPPSSVKLTSINEGLEITIFDPLDNNNQSMTKLADKMYYFIQYWKRSEDAQKAETMSTSSNVVTLSKLDRWMSYCVRVQSRDDFYNKRSIFTDTDCKQTKGEVTSLQIFLYFMLSLGLCFLVMFALSFACYKTYKTLKSTFYPSTLLPGYIQENWTTDMPPMLIPESENVCENLDITSEINVSVAVTDAHIFEEDPTIETHNQHDSGDSGFNSTEEDSCHRPYDLKQPIICNDNLSEKLCKIKNKANA